MKRYLRNVYNDSIDCEHDIEVLNKSRDAIMESHQYAYLQLALFRYYCQLEQVSLRIPVSDKSSTDCCIAFTWKNLFNREEYTQYSLAFEKACVLFNMAAAFSHIGAESELKAAYAAFQAAAGICLFVAENFVSAPSVDLFPETMKALSSVMLAQAQDAFLRKAEEGTKSFSVLAKLASYEASLYMRAAEGLSQLWSEHSWGEKEWASEAEENSKYMKALSNYYWALYLDSNKKNGEALAHMRNAKEYFEELKYGSYRKLDAKQKIAQVSSRLSSMERDNDLVYHEIIPDTVKDIAHIAAAQPTPLNMLYPDKDQVSRLVGENFLSSVVPLDVHEKASLYSEMKAEIARDLQEKADVANEELHSAFDYLDLPRSALLLRKPHLDEDDSPEVPQIVKEWSREVRDCKLNVDFEEKRQKVYRLIAGATSNDPNVTFQIQQIKQSLLSSEETDKSLAQNLMHITAVLAELSSFEALATAFKADHVTGSKDLLDFQEESNPLLETQLDRVIQGTAKLNKLCNERSRLLSDLKSAFKEDEILSVLVLNRNNPKVEQTVFPQELAKFNPAKERILRNIERQAALLEETSNMWKHILATETIRKRANDRETRITYRHSLLEKYRSAYNQWRDIKEGCERAADFYAKLEQSALSAISTNVSLGMSGLNIGSDRILPRSFTNDDASGHAPPLPPKPGSYEVSGYSVPSAYSSSLYNPSWNESK